MSSEFEDILLSITKKYDEKKKQDDFLQVQEKPSVNQKTITDQDENLMLLERIKSKKRGTWDFGSGYSKGREVFGYKNGEYTVQLFPKTPKQNIEWVITKNNMFLTRITKISTDSFRFKLRDKNVRKLNLGYELEQIIKDTIKTKETDSGVIYALFTLNFTNSLDCIDEIFAIDERDRNNII